MAHPNPDAFENDAGYPYLAVSREEKAASAGRPFDSKKNVWVPDAEDGKILIYNNYYYPSQFVMRVFKSFSNLKPSDSFF